MPTVHLHDARHTVAALLLDLGMSLPVAQMILGHASIAITADVYSHVMPGLQTDALERLGALLTADPVAKAVK